MPSLLDSAAKAACECPHCRRVLRIRLDFANRLAACRGCGARFRVPSHAELVDFSASELIAANVDVEFRARSRRAASVFERRRHDRDATPGEVADPFLALGAR